MPAKEELLNNVNKQANPSLRVSISFLLTERDGKTTIYAVWVRSCPRSRHRHHPRNSLSSLPKTCWQHHFGTGLGASSISLQSKLDTGQAAVHPGSHLTKVKALQSHVYMYMYINIFSRIRRPHAWSRMDHAFGMGVVCSVLLC